MLRVKPVSVWVTVTVTPVSDNNRPPDAVDDNYTMVRGEILQLHLLINDSDPDGDAITIVSNTDPAHGFVLRGSGGEFYYQSLPSFKNGTDYFTYTIVDTHGLSDTATVAIRVNASPPTGAE